MLESCEPLPSERVGLADALGRTLAQPAVASAPVPGFDNSAMDGFAVRAQDLQGASPGSPATLTLAGESRAGSPCMHVLRPGEAITISTGAMIPAGADAVLRIEDAHTQDGRVLAYASPRPGAEVRRTGEDVAAGEIVLEASSVLGPAELGVLASLGLASVACHKRPRVSVLTTGDELAPPGRPLPAGSIHDSNSYAIAALCVRAGAEVARLAHVGDDPLEVERAIASALDADVTIVCGGISVGAHDHVQSALAAAGVRQRFAGIALRPGRPTWFGLLEERPVFALPGNPVSAMVTFILLAGPALRALSGAPVRRQRTVATLLRDCDKRPGRTHAVRCKLSLGEDGWLAEPTGPQGSHVLTSMLGADALAILPRDSGPARAGDRVEIELLSPWTR